MAKGCIVAEDIGMPNVGAGFKPAPATDIQWMQRALKAAEKGEEGGGGRPLQKRDVPVGAVWVSGEDYVTACNVKEQENDPTGHAEIQVLRKVASACSRWRLGGTLYVTLEPCPMCAGAILEARVDRLVFGAWDPKAGACGSVWNIIETRKIRHPIDVVGGVCAEASETLLKGFFAALRRRNREPVDYGEMAELG